MPSCLVFGGFFISRSKGLQSSVSLLVPRKLAVTTLNLHQCDNSFFGPLGRVILVTITRGKHACSDGVC